MIGVHCGRIVLKLTSNETFSYGLYSTKVVWSSKSWSFRLKIAFFEYLPVKNLQKTGRGDVPGYRVRIFFLKFFVVVPDMVGQLLTYGRKLFEQILFFWTGLVYSIHYTSRAQMGHLSKHISGTLTAGYWTAIRTTSARYWSWFYTDYRHAIGRLLQQTGYNIGWEHWL